MYQLVKSLVRGRAGKPRDKEREDARGGASMEEEALARARATAFEGGRIVSAAEEETFSGRETGNGVAVARKVERSGSKGASMHDDSLLEIQPRA